MKLILHIGTPKTGSTTIQNFLKLNRNLLDSESILVPKTISTNDGNHRWASVFAYDNDFEDEFTKKIFTEGSKSREELIDEKFNEFKKEIAMSNANICIISSEHLSSRLRKIENIYKLKHLFNDFFEEISILLYIRKPIEAAISLLSTQIKTGQTPQGLDLEFFSNNLNNLKVIKNWENAFLKSNLRIKLFNKENFIDGDLIKDFCAECKIKYSKNFKTHKRSNETLNLDQMKYLKYLNQYFPLLKKNKLNKKRRNLTRFIIENFQSSNQFLPTKDQYRLFEKHFAIDNHYIKKEYFSDKKQLWSTYKKEFAEQENILDQLSKREIEFLNSIKKLWYTNN